MATAELEQLPEHVEHAHDDRVAHHFDSAQQQFDAGKLGMWLFLVNEVLFFSGLFVAYAVYRSNHPEVFVNAHKYLNTTLGACNTIVLLVSSLTMAWAVRAAQLNQKRLLVRLLAATLACASLFLGIKAVEYSHKWDAGLLWAGAYSAEVANEPEEPEGAPSRGAEGHAKDSDHAFSEHAAGGDGIAQTSASDTALAEHDAHHQHSRWLSRSLLVLSLPFGLTLIAAVAAYRFTRSEAAARFWFCCIVMSAAFFVGVVFGQVVESFSTHTSDTAVAISALTNDELAEQQKYTGVFFSIYYCLTGVHALHILVGMGVIAWILWRAIKQQFDDENFAAVDNVGLYWHLVDLVWVYLFPLLYLIR